MKRNHKRMWRSVVSVLLVLSLVLGSVSTVFATEGSETKNYVSIGDSMTNGYGLDGYEEPDGYGNITNWFGFQRDDVKGSYPYKVADNYNWNLDQIATSGLRADDVYYLLNLGTDYEVNWDEYGRQYMAEKFKQSYKSSHDGSSGSDDEIIAWAAEQYQKSVKDADVISIGIGSNNFATLMDMRMMWWMGKILGDESMFSGGGYQGPFDFDELVGDLTEEERAQINELYDEVEKTLMDAAAEAGVNVDMVLAESSGDTVGDFIKDMTNAIAYTSAGFALGYKGTVDTIIRENDDAEIIIVGLTNWFRGMVYGVPVGDKMIEFPLGELMESVCEFAGVYMAGLPAAYEAEAKLNETELQPIYFADTNAEGVEDVELIVDEIVANTADVDLSSMDKFAVGSNERFEAAKEIAQKIDSSALPSGTVRDRLLETMGDYVMSMMGMRVPTIIDVEHYEAYLGGGYTATKDCEIVVTFNGNPVYTHTYYEAGNDADVNAYFNDKYNVIPATIALEDFITEEELNSIYGQIMGGANPVDTLTPYIGDAIGDTIYAAVYPYNEGCIAYLGLEKSMISSLHLDVVNVEHFEVLSSVTNLMNVTWGALKPHMSADPNDIAGALISVPELGTVSNLMFNFLVGSGVIVHPSDAGHTTIANVIIDAYDNKWTATDETVDNIIYAVKEYYDEAYAIAYQYADKNGYIDDAIKGIEDVEKAMADAVDKAKASGMSDALKDELEEAYKEALETTAQLKKLIKEADVLDEATYNEAMVLVAELEDDLYKLAEVMEQVGIDTLDQLWKAYEYLKPIVIEQLKIAVEKGTEWLMKKVDEAYAAFIEALPEIDAFLYDWLYENPELVLGFFYEYGDEMGKFIEENYEIIGAVIGYIGYTYGDDVLQAILDDPEGALKDFVAWYNKYGERTWKMIDRYMEASGLKDLIKEKAPEIIQGAIEEAVDLVEKYGEEVLKEVYAYLEDNGYIDILNAAIEDFEEALDAIEANYVASTSFTYELNKDNYYVALGDSTAYPVEYKKDEVVPYGDRLAKELGLANGKYKNLSKENVTAEEVLAAIEENKEDIAKSDLITLGMGNGTIIEFVLNQITSDPVELDWSKLAGEAGAAEIEKALAKIEEKLLESMDQKTAGLMMVAFESYAYKYAELAAEYPQIIEAIHEINPETQVVIVGMYNPLEGVVIAMDGMEEVAIGDYLDYIVKVSNAYYLGVALLNENTVYVDAPAVENNVAEGEMGLRQMMNLLLNPEALYPTDAGHEYIKEQIMDITTLTEGLLWGDANRDGKVSPIDASFVLQYYTKQMTEEDLDVRASDVNGDGKVTPIDASFILQYYTKQIDKFPAER